MSSSYYSRYLRICKLWQVDATKQNRDLGEYLRKQIVVLFPNGELTNIYDAEKYEKNITALEKLSCNLVSKKLNDLNSVKYTTATGFKKSELQALLSTKYLEQSQQEDNTLLTKLKNTLDMHINYSTSFKNT